MQAVVGRHVGRDDLVEHRQHGPGRGAGQAPAAGRHADLAAGHAGDRDRAASCRPAGRAPRWRAGWPGRGRRRSARRSAAPRRARPWAPASMPASGRGLRRSRCGRRCPGRAAAAARRRGRPWSGRGRSGGGRRRDDQHQVLVEQRPAGQLGARDRQVDDGQVEAAAGQLGLEGGRCRPRRRPGAPWGAARPAARAGGAPASGRWCRSCPAGRCRPPRAAGRPPRPPAPPARRRSAGPARRPPRPPRSAGSPAGRPAGRPSSFSSRATWLETLDWTVWRASAAAEKLPWSATATSAASWRSSMISFADSSYRE